MTVLRVERVSVSLRGELSRWMLQVAPGLFVGRLALPVRDRIWRMACSKAAGGSAVMIEMASGEQGYAIRLWGVPPYVAEDHEGLVLIRERSARA